MNKKQVLWKSGVLLNIAVVENTDTLEDASAISEETSNKFTTRLTEVRNIVVNFDQSVKNLVKINQQVEADDYLCIIEEAVTAENDLFNDVSLDTLKLISSNQPKAKVKGIVEKIEMFYHGSIDELSENLTEIALESDLNRKKIARDSGTNYTSGQVDGSLRINGNPLPLKQAVIKIYITHDLKAGVADKGVFCNQMKTIFSRILSGANETESGIKIDGMFGRQSIDNRIVNSFDLIGTTITLLKLISNDVASSFFD